MADLKELFFMLGVTTVHTKSLDKLISLIDRERRESYERALNEVLH